MKEVELHSAYHWDCDECGSPNFVRAIVVELNEEDKKAMLERYGGDPDDWTTGNWMSRPDEVECESCGAKFATIDPDGLYGKDSNT